MPKSSDPPKKERDVINLGKLSKPSLKVEVNPADKEALVEEMRNEAEKQHDLRKEVLRRELLYTLITVVASLLGLVITLTTFFSKLSFSATGFEIAFAILMAVFMLLALKTKLLRTKLSRHKKDD